MWPVLEGLRRILDPKAEIRTPETSGPPLKMHRGGPPTTQIFDVAAGSLHTGPTAKRSRHFQAADEVQKHPPAKLTRE